MYKLSRGNSKLGNILNANVPAGVTCAPGAPCKGQGCYALKGTYLYKNVQARYQENLKSFLDKPLTTRSEILDQIPENKELYFRWHSSGDIVNERYFIMMVNIAERRPRVKFLAFTKKYDLVNKYIERWGPLPDNLTIVFSHWRGFPMNNPHNLPVTAVVELSDINTDQFTPCVGSCKECKKCWSLKAGEGVKFNKH